MLAGLHPDPAQRRVQRARVVAGRRAVRHSAAATSFDQCGQLAHHDEGDRGHLLLVPQGNLPAALLQRAVQLSAGILAVHQQQELDHVAIRSDQQQIAGDVPQREYGECWRNYLYLIIRSLFSTKNIYI